MTPNPTRREILKTVAAGAMATAGAALAGGCASTEPNAAAPTDGPSLAEGKIHRAVAPRVEPFPLSDVRLLDGPFLSAQQRDAKYLLDLEPDRMLHNFRVNAGLTPKAPVYGGWESVQTWADIRAHGHTLGHYLTACSLMYASTGDAQFKQRVDYIVTELRECQNATADGFICAFPDKTAQIDNMLAGRAVIGVPWYTMHKILAGLRDAKLYCGNSDAMKIAVKLCDWIGNSTKNLTDEQFERMLRTEHGGMNEVLADIYVQTGNPKYLALAQRFCHRAVLDPLAQSRDTLDRLHSNTQIPKFVGFSRLYGLTGRDDYRAASQFFWQTVVNNRSFVTGGNADGEHFFPPRDFARHLNSAKTMETCCSHNMLRLTRMLFEFDPSATYADYYERTLYNTILASQDPDSGMMTYFQSTRPGYMKLYCTPIDSFWCCTGTGMENHAKYGDSIYFHSADAVYVNLFIPSTVDWKAKNLSITQTTGFPETEKTRLRVATGRSVEFTMNIRHPSWCQRTMVMLNGKPLEAQSTPGSYISIHRTWNSGDEVEVSLPMTLRAMPLPGSTDVLAFVNGPIVLVAALGSQGIAPGADLIVNERTYGDVLNEPFEVPTLVGDPATIIRSIRRSGVAPLTFTTSGIGKPRDVTLVPYCYVAHERYNMYWKVGPA